MVVFLVLYYVNHFFLNAADPTKDSYIPFIAADLNYISGFINLILETSNLFAHWCGLPTRVISPDILQVDHGPGIVMLYPCAGIGVTTFWIAVIVSHNTSWQQKLVWCLAGSLIIFLINCIRITLLMLSLQYSWPIFARVPHHTMFKIASYGIIFFMIYLYNKTLTKNDVRLTSV
jgi:exosortase/archaeosortase family protein